MLYVYCGECSFLAEVGETEGLGSTRVSRRFEDIKREILANHNYNYPGCDSKMFKILLEPSHVTDPLA